jgi:hypothetical protein
MAVTVIEHEMEFGRSGDFKRHRDQIPVPLFSHNQAAVHNFTREFGYAFVDGCTVEEQSCFLNENIASVISWAASGPVKIRWSEMHNHRAVPLFDLGNRRVVKFYHSVHFDKRLPNPACGREGHNDCGRRDQLNLAADPRHSKSIPPKFARQRLFLRRARW